jgi:hypothetical protein
MAKSKLRQLVGFPWAADSCPWVGKLRTMLPSTNRDVIRDSAVQLGLTHQRGAIGVDSTTLRVPEAVNVCVPVMVNHGVPVGACVRAYSRKSGSILRCMFPCMLCTDRITIGVV